MLPLLLALAILIAVAKLMGHAAVRLGQPAVLGELLAGLVLGPTFIDVMRLPLLARSDLPSIIHDLGQLGVLWLMFAAGLEIELRDMRSAGMPAVLSGVFGVLAPLLLGFGAARLFRFASEDALFIGIVLSATSVSISAQTLMELGQLRSREGAALLGAAVIDDILVIMALSVFSVLAAGGATMGAVFQDLGTMVLVLLVVGLLSLFFLPRLAEWSRQIRASEGMLAIVLAATLFLSWATEFFGGVAAITGAFLAGVSLGGSHLRSEIEQGLHRIAYAFFVPIFLVDIGLQANMRSLLGGGLGLVGLLILVAIISKLIGSGGGSMLGGFNGHQALRMGLGMVSRGEVGLIVASVGVAEGIMPQEHFTAIVVVVLVTTLLTPIMLRAAYSAGEGANATTHISGGG
jgi:Kef-type K+ transport system membrane component KefB